MNINDLPIPIRIPIHTDVLMTFSFRCLFMYLVTRMRTQTERNYNFFEIIMFKNGSAAKINGCVKTT